MSSKPDGNDPRILQPEGKTVYMSGENQKTAAEKYHEKDCDYLDRVDCEPVEKDISVAKWKDMTPCDFCNPTEKTEYDTEINGPQIDHIRRALVEGYSCPTVAEEYNIAPRTVREHASANRDYDYPTDPTYPVVQHGWYINE